MADLVIHNIDPDLETRLRDRAMEKGWTVEDEAVTLLSGLLLARSAGEQGAGYNLGTQIVQLFAGTGLKPGEELERPDWTWEPPDFGK